MPSEAKRDGQYNNWTVDEIRPYFLYVLQHFGYERMIFGGNWFFVNLATTYREWASAASVLLDNATVAERNAVLGGNAARI